MLKTLLILICLIGLSSCGLSRANRPIPLERYNTPAAPQFTLEEKGLIDALGGVQSAERTAFEKNLSSEDKFTLLKYGPTAQTALRKIMLQKNAWRAIVLKHNEIATKQVKAQMKEFGYSEEQIAAFVIESEKPLPEPKAEEVKK